MYLPAGCGVMTLNVYSTNGTYNTSGSFTVGPTPVSPQRQAQLDAEARAQAELQAQVIAREQAYLNASTAANSLSQCQEDKAACEAEFSNMSFGGFAVNSVAADGRTLLDHCLNDGGVWARGKRRCDPNGCHC